MSFDIPKDENFTLNNQQIPYPQIQEWDHNHLIHPWETWRETRTSISWCPKPKAFIFTILKADRSSMALGACGALISATAAPRWLKQSPNK